MNANDCAEIENRKGANLNPNIKRSSITSPNPINRQSLKSLNEIEIPSMSEMQAKAKKFYEKAKTKFNWHSTNVEDNLAEFENVCVCILISTFRFSLVYLRFIFR